MMLNKHLYTLSALFIFFMLSGATYALPVGKYYVRYLHQVHAADHVHQLFPYWSVSRLEAFNSRLDAFETEADRERYLTQYLNSLKQTINSLHLPNNPQGISVQDYFVIRLDPANPDAGAAMIGKIVWENDDWKVEKDTIDMRVR